MKKNVYVSKPKNVKEHEMSYMEEPKTFLQPTFLHITERITVMLMFSANTNWNCTNNFNKKKKNSTS